jgi:hypothetical protein
MSLMLADTYDRMLNYMEGRVFGGHFRFMVIGYCNQLYTSLPNGGWVEVKGFRDWDKMNDFAKEMDAAIKPVVEKYAKLLRQDLANELIRVAAEETKDL